VNETETRMKKVDKNAIWLKKYKKNDGTGIKLERANDRHYNKEDLTMAMSDMRANGAFTKLPNT
jgi:hypothetical protein